MQRTLICDFSDLPGNTIQRQVTAIDQLGVLCQLNRRTCQRLSKTVFLILSNFPPASLLENSVSFLQTDHGWCLEFSFANAPMRINEASLAETDRNLGSLRRAGERLESFQIGGSLAEGFEIKFTQSLKLGFQVPRARELRQWARMISDGDWEHAFEGLSRIYSSSRAKVQQLRDGVSIRREVLNGDAGQAEAILSLVASKTENPVIILDHEGNIEWMNQAFHELTRIEKNSAGKHSAAKILSANDQDDSGCNSFAASLAKGRSFKFEYLWRTESETNPDTASQPIWIEFQITPVRDEDDKVIRWIAIGANVTQRRQAELAMQAARDIAESASKAKSEFLAMMSHEIRTPMNAIIGMTELTLGTKLSTEQREYLSTANNSAQLLLQILNDVLDLSKVEARRLEIEATDFNIADLTRDTLESLAILAQKKSLALSCKFPLEIPQNLVGDPNRLRQILVNLVGNAIKFTTKGEVVVEAEMTDETNDRVTLHFRVRDTGVGIAEDKISRIFEAFYQTDASVSRDFGGTGLGLAITSELVRLMGGRIWVESKLGSGSAFHFVCTLPKSMRVARGIETLADKPGFSPIEKTLRPVNVLVVDDQPSNLNLVSEILRRRGHHWETASNGEQAIELIREREFDVVLMDVQMPVLDGIQTTALIRELPGTKSLTPIIAITAYVTHDDRQRCIDARMDDYLSKPIKISELLEKTELWGATDRNAESLAKTASRLPDQPPQQDLPDWATRIANTVLLASDDPLPVEGSSIQLPETNLACDATDEPFKAALLRLGGDVDLLKMQMEFLLTEAPQLLLNLQQAIPAGDAKSLHLNAHRLRGLARSYDDELGFDIASRLEEMSRTGKFAEAESLSALLLSCFDRLTDRVKAYLATDSCPPQPTETSS